MLGAGYSISALSTFVLGAVRDLSGSFSATLWIVAIATASLVGACLPLAALALAGAAQTEGAA